MRCDFIELPSFAKVNLGLWVLGEREDGYHEIVTVLQTVSLKDTIRMRRREREIRVKTDSKDIPSGKENICYKAAKVFFERSALKEGVEIEIKKVIPVGRGLGGGSSNGTVTLMGLNILHSKPYDDDELRRLAAKIGSDTPFFVRGGTAIARGRGEIIEEGPPSIPMFFLIYSPPFGISTTWAYRNLPPLTERENVDIILRGIEEGDIEKIGRGLHNSFETLVYSRYPELKRVKEYMLEKDACGALLSGSGSGVYGLFKDKKTATLALEDFPFEGRVWVVESVSEREYRSYFGA